MRARPALLLAALLTALAFPATALATNPPIRHVFIIVLENESASTTFGPHSPAPYLSKTLRAKGAYLPHYYAIGHESNDNYIAMISGQAPTVQSQSDCMFFDDLTPGTIGAYGQAEGTGCVYPASVATIASQLLARGFTWRDYNESMGADPAREASECGHPGLNQVDNTQKATSTDQYAARHNPFVYFHSIIDDTTLCDTHVVNLDLLQQDLASASNTPSYVFITPNLCDDGHDSPCADGEKGGLPQIDKFLRTWVPRITSSPAFRTQDGLLIINFDEAATSDASACCNEVAGPDSPKPGVTGPGGGDTGAVLISPCIRPGTVSSQPYNHYTMLRSVEDLFGLSHLGYAGLPGERSFGSDVFTRSCPLAPVGCPAPTGRLSGTSLGPVQLGMTRASARRAFANNRSTRGRDYMDFFCLNVSGIRVGYPSPKLLGTLPPSERARVTGRVVLALTANPYYSIQGVRVGARLRSVAARLHVGQGLAIGLNTWYLFANGPSRGVFKVRHGIIEEIGIADRTLTQGRRAAWQFMTSFS